jgi:hypothetical protein
MPSFKMESSMLIVKQANKQTPKEKCQVRRIEIDIQA